MPRLRYTTSVFECVFCGLRTRQRAGKSRIVHVHREEEAMHLAREEGYRVTPEFCEFPVREVGPISDKSADPVLSQVWMA